MKNSYIIDYVNENEFHKKERAIKKYNMLAYKKLLFDYYPSLRDGNFPGVMTSSNEEDNTSKYELTLPTDKTFVMVHGNITLHYTVYEKDRIIMLEDIKTNDDILTEGHQKELTTYKGVMVSKEHKDLDMFKINLLNSISKNGFFKLNKPLWIIILIAIILLVSFLIFKLI